VDTDPWVNDDGSTDVDAFLTAYHADDNTFWRADSGHIQNVLDTLLDGPTPEEAVRVLLRHVGDDPDRDGLRDTPRRVVRALEELTRGRHTDPCSVLSTVFEERYDELILVDGIAFASLCEHHLLPFTGTATIGYIPNEPRVVGVSKLARLVEVCAARLQVQERLTSEIADAIGKALDCLGVGVVIRARHSCMATRGVRSPAVMTTSVTLGALRDKPAARAEFLALANGGAARP
jgi:GTP cyclohydrolase I